MKQSTSRKIEAFLKYLEMKKTIKRKLLGDLFLIRFFSKIYLHLNTFLLFFKGLSFKVCKSSLFILIFKTASQRKKNNQKMFNLLFVQIQSFYFVYILMYN